MTVNLSVIKILKPQIIMLQKTINTDNENSTILVSLKVGLVFYPKASKGFCLLMLWALAVSLKLALQTLCSGHHIRHVSN